MTQHKIFIIGDSMFAEMIATTLGEYEVLEVVGKALTVDEALPKLAVNTPDVVVIADTNDGTGYLMCPLVHLYPELPIIRTDLSSDTMQLITSKRVRADGTGLLAAVSALAQASDISGSSVT